MRPFGWNAIEGTAGEPDEQETLARIRSFVVRVSATSRLPRPMMQRAEPRRGAELGKPQVLGPYEPAWV